MIHPYLKMFIVYLVLLCFYVIFTHANTHTIETNLCIGSGGADTTSWVGVSLIQADGSHTDIVEYNPEGDHWTWTGRDVGVDFGSSIGTPKAVTYHFRYINSTFTGHDTLCIRTPVNVYDINTNTSYTFDYVIDTDTGTADDTIGNEIYMADYLNCADNGGSFAEPCQQTLTFISSSDVNLFSIYKFKIGLPNYVDAFSGSVIKFNITGQYNSYQNTSEIDRYFSLKNQILSCAGIGPVGINITFEIAMFKIEGIESITIWQENQFDNTSYDLLIDDFQIQAIDLDDSFINYYWVFSVGKTVSNAKFVALADANTISANNVSHVTFRDQQLSIPANGNQSQTFHIGIHTCNSSQLEINDTAILQMSTTTSYHNFNYVSSPAVTLDPSLTYNASTNWLYYDWKGFNIFYGFNYTSTNDKILATITVNQFDWCIDKILFWNYQFSSFALCFDEQIIVSAGTSYPIELNCSELTYMPTSVPSHVPSYNPTSIPSHMPSTVPSTDPSAVPSYNPSTIPSNFPSSEPSVASTSTHMHSSTTIVTDISTTMTTTMATTIPPTTVPAQNPSKMPTAPPLEESPEETDGSDPDSSVESTEATNKSEGYLCNVFVSAKLFVTAVLLLKIGLL